MQAAQAVDWIDGRHEVHLRWLQTEERFHVKNKRYDARRDESEPDIVAALVAAGWDVYRDLPIDLLCIKGKKVKLLEVKTPTKTGKRRKRKDQEEQDAFIAKYEVPVVLTPMDALLAVGETVELT